MAIWTKYSGAMNTSNSNVKYRVKLVLNSQDIANNRSNVTVSIQVWRTNTGYTTYGSGTAYATINGTNYSAAITSSHKFTYNSYTEVFSRTLNIPHDSDGSKVLTIAARIAHSQFSSSAQYWSQSLDTIPRASSISGISGNTIGSPITVSISRASSAFTHTVKYKRTDGLVVTLATGIGTSHTFTPSLSDANLLPNSTSGTASIIVDTYNGSSKIGTATKAFTLYVPSSMVPIINTVSIDEAVAGIKEKFGAYVKTKSKLALGMTAVGAYGSTITTYKMTANGTSYNSSSATTDVLKASGTNRITFEVTDSRGRKASVAREITVLDYFNPFISTLSATRSNSDGTVNEEGTHAKISYLAGISPVNNKNDKSFIVRYRVNGTENWTETDVTGTEYTINTSSVIANFDVDYSYDIQLVVSDYFTSIIMQATLPTGFSLINFHENGKALAFGKVSSGNGLEIGIENTFEKAPTIIAPTSTAADGAFARLRRSDESLLAFIATGANGTGLNVHLYNGTAWSGMVTIGENGDIYTTGSIRADGGVI